MNFICLCVLLFSSGLVGLGEVPRSEALGAVSFTERQKAFRALEDWVLGNQAEAKVVILENYLRCPDPEVRVRLLGLLERSYFPLKGFVGITMRSVLWDQPGRFQNENEALGVRVTNVGADTPAEAGGLRVDDVLLKINDWEVKGGADVTSLVSEQIQKHSPTTPVSLLVQRGEEELTIVLNLGILPTPSVRARMLRKDMGSPGGILPPDLQREISSFQDWLTEEIEKDRKNLIADRRL